MMRLGFTHPQPPLASLRFVKPESLLLCLNLVLVVFEAIEGRRRRSDLKICKQAIILYCSNLLDLCNCPRLDFYHDRWLDIEFSP